MNRYINNDINNPKYLFHGSPKKLKIIKQNQSYDSYGNKENEDYAVFMTSSFIIASVYTFKDKIKELSKEIDWDFVRGRDIETDEIFVKMNIGVD